MGGWEAQRSVEAKQHRPGVDGCGGRKRRRGLAWCGFRPDLDGVKRGAGLRVRCGAAASAVRRRSMVGVECQRLPTEMDACLIIRPVRLALKNVMHYTCRPGKDIGILASGIAVLHKKQILLLYFQANPDVPDRKRCSIIVFILILKPI